MILSLGRLFFSETIETNETNINGKISHAREPLYSKSAVVAWWLQSTSAQKEYLAVNKGNILVNILLMKIFIKLLSLINPVVYLLLVMCTKFEI